MSMVKNISAEDFMARSIVPRLAEIGTDLEKFDALEGLPDAMRAGLGRLRDSVSKSLNDGLAVRNAMAASDVPAVKRVHDQF